MEANDSQLSTTLFYLKPDSKWKKEKPFTLFVDVSKVKDAGNTNIVKEAVENVLITDIRDNSASLSLDRNGFEVIDLSCDSAFSLDSFEDEQWVRSNYYPFLCQLLKDKLGAKEVRPYEHKLRYRHPGFGDSRFRGHMNYDPPIPQVHADMTPTYGESFFKEIWPEAVGSDRLQIVNVWRPLLDQVTEWPLALCDHASVNHKLDLQATDQVKRQKESKESNNAFVAIESYAAYYRPEHVWYYLKNQRCHEGWLLKLYDSQEDAAQSILHTSFDIGEGKQPRRSVETRLMVRH